MSNPKITVVDYGMGNLWSVISALRHLGCSPLTSSDPDEIARADTLLLPGVGSFRKAMIALQQTGIDQAITEAVQVNGRKILGICLGMQLMGLGSSEDGDTIGLGFINSTVTKFTFEEIGNNKLPHIGFDSVHSHSASHLFKNLRKTTDFYFVHSYRMLPSGIHGTLATCHYGIEFLAAYERDNVFATQFHPEKSQANGLMLLKNFLEV